MNRPQMPPAAVSNVQDLFPQALQYHQAGRLKEAEPLYRQILQRDPRHADALHMLGVLALQVGRPDAAADLITKAIAENAQVPAFHCNLGNALQGQGKLAAAAESYRRALLHRPTFAEAHYNLGSVLHAQGKLVEAIASYAQAVAYKPDLVDAHNDLGIALQAQGRLEEAVVSFGQALRHKPDYVKGHSNLGNALKAQGKLVEAVASYGQALAHKPDYAEAHTNLGNALQALGKGKDAVAAYEQALVHRPDLAEAHSSLGVTLQAQGKLAAAVASFERALTYKPDFAEAHCNLGNVFRAEGKLEVAIACYQRALTHAPDLPEAHSNLGVAYREQGKLAEAVASYRQALRRKPDYAEAHSNLGNVLVEQGKLDEAVASFAQALAYKPDLVDVEMNLAFAQLYRSGVGLADMLALASHWNEAHAARFRDRWFAHDRPVLAAAEAGGEPDRRPRLGFVSADFRAHAVGSLMIPVIEGLAYAGFHLTCYSNSHKSDGMTARFVKAASVWRPVAGLSDDALAEQIRADAIDILIDLSGYSDGHRLLTFARKPAPIQVGCWGGYPATSGLTGMDYFLGDRHQVPLGAEAYYSEAVVRLPDSYVAFEPPPDAPPVAVLPALSQKRVTFGSFNGLKKITPEVVLLWSRLLARLPSSRLLLKTPALDCAATRQDYAAQFAAHGVAAARLTFIGRTSQTQHMASMRQVDIALDSFPYAGGQTTLEVLWMGLPVITLPGETFASRHSLSYLSTVGLTELVASNADGYINLAVDLANDLARLANLRSTMRARILASPLCDVDRFTGNLATALTTMWRRWCNGQTPVSFDVSPGTRSSHQEGHP